MKHLPVIFVFLLGMLAGAGVVRMRRFPPHFGPPKPEKIAQRMAKDLDLNETQTEQLKQIFESNGEEMRSFQKAMRGRFEVLRERIDAKIDGILTLEQKVKFAKIREKRRRRGYFPPPLPPP